MEATEKKKLIILDTHAILHRAYHAIPDFFSSKGEPTGALYGFLSMLTKIISDLKPDYVVAAVDLPDQTYRHAAFDGYKAHRKETESDLIAQIKKTPAVLKRFGIPVYSAPGYEADDCIGTIVEQTKHKQNLDVIIASGDMDALQLVEGERVRVYTLKKGLNDTILYDEPKVRERFGFGPELLTDYKGLRGDPSDNIPGVKGIGEKTASDLISKFGSIDDIYKTLKKHPDWLANAGIKSGMIKKLEEQEEQARLSKELAVINRNTPIHFILPKEEWLPGVSAKDVMDMLAEFEFRALVPRIRTLLDSGKSKTSEVREFSAENSLSSRVVTLESPLQPSFSSVSDKELEKLFLAVWVLDSNITQPQREDMERVGESLDIAEARETILKKIKENNLEFVYEKIELPLTPVLRAMERRGIKVDKKFLQKLSLEYSEELEKISARIYEAAGSEFNISSPKQLGNVLFDTLGLAAKNQKKTAGGQRSTKESELEKMKDSHPIINDILAHRELSKLLSTYIDAIPTMLDKEDRLHTSYIQTGTTTGRLSSQNPNLQNIPIKTDLGRAIRRAFVAPSGMRLVSFDYSQIELRIAALLSGDEGLIEIFKRGGDVHAEVAARIFHIAPKEVDYEQRRRAKVINFGILYGMGVNSLRAALDTTRAEAQDFYNEYFEAFPRLAAYINEVKAHAARTGHTETLFGRRRYFEGIKSPIPYVRAAAERMAINAPIQGTQADIIKLAMVRIDELFSVDANLLLQVHDELVFEITEEKIKDLAQKIKEIMENVLPEKQRKGIPIIAEGKAGDNWGEMLKI